MLGSPDTPATLWARFIDLIATCPDLLSAVCQHMSSIERQSMRGIDRAMRVAMNATVSVIRCTQVTMPTHQQLHMLFPNASSMDLYVQRYYQCGFRESEWRVCLKQLARSNEPLLAKLRHLSLTVRPVTLNKEGDGQAILELLAR
jgi:hypothetical protein